MAGPWPMVVIHGCGSPVHSDLSSLLKRSDVPLPSRCGSAARRASPLGTYRLCAREAHREVRSIRDGSRGDRRSPLHTYAEHVQVQGRSGRIPQDPDADDDKFIDTALTSYTTIIVSGDRHLLALGTVEGGTSWRPNFRHPFQLVSGGLPAVARQGRRIVPEYSRTSVCTKSTKPGSHVRSLIRCVAPRSDWRRPPGAPRADPRSAPRRALKAPRRRGPADPPG